MKMLKLWLRSRSASAFAACALRSVA